MKFFFTFFFLLITTSLFAQIGNWDQQLQNTVYNNAPADIKRTKAFVREWVFFEPRAYPNNYIPEEAYSKAMIQKEQLRSSVKYNPLNLTWVSLGPTSGYYFSYGNISSRIVTGAFNPSIPNIIYIGPANGGVWKSIDGGTNWTPLTDNQPSMSMGAIAIDPLNNNIIYAGTGEATYSGASYYGRGLLKSTDAGATWTHITSGLPASSYFSRIVIRPGNSSQLFAAMGSAGLYKSTNAGVSWTPWVATRADEVLYSLTGDTVFASGAGTGLIRSTDGGITFNNFGTGIPSSSRLHIDMCKSNPAIMYAASYVSSSTSVNAYKSTNFGATWTQISLTTNLNGAQAWYDLYVRVNPSNPDIAYIGTIDVYRTTDGGTNFYNITNGYSGGIVHVDQHYAFFHPTDPNIMFFCNDGGIWKSNDGGTSTFNLNQNLTLTQFYRIASSPFQPGRILGGTQDNGTQQTYSTINWQAAFGGDGGEVCFNPFDQNFILGESQNGGLQKTTNGGANWSSATSGITTSEAVAWVAPIIAHPTIPGTFYTARQRVYKSTNNGIGWTAVSGNVYLTSAIREMAISKTNPDYLYASVGPRIFRSTDGGVTFTNVTQSLPNRTITSINVDPRNANTVFITLSGFSGGHVYRSTDAGASWINISSNLPDSPVNDLFVYTADPSAPNFYFIGSDIGVFYTRDGGSTWIETYDGLPNTVIIHLDFSPLTNTLRAGTHGRGVYEAFINNFIPVEMTSFTAAVDNKSILLKWTTSTETNNKMFEVERKLKNMQWEKIGEVKGNGTTTNSNNYSFNDNLDMFYEGRILYRLKQIDLDGTYEYTKYIYADVDLMPKEIILYQNYPNPFNPSTSIKYYLTGESKVNLSIFNPIGEKISELVNKTEQGGIHEVTWNASDLTSGVYFYSLEVKGNDNKTIFNEKRKLLLVK